MTTEKKQNWYFTFGCGQKHAKKYVTFYGTCVETIDMMFKVFDDKWSTQYQEKDGERVVKKWGLVKLEVL